MKLSKNFITTVAVGSALLLGGLAFAQDKPAATPPAGTPPAATPAPAKRDASSYYVQYLKLSDEQQTKFKPILQDEMTKMGELRKDKTLTPEVRTAKMREIRDGTTAQMKPILNDEQFEKWQKMRGRGTAAKPPAAKPAGAPAAAPGAPAPGAAPAAK
jgi:hypothetical protein